MCLSLDYYPAFCRSKLMCVGVIDDSMVPSKYSMGNCHLSNFYWWHLTNSSACGSSACGNSYYIWSEFFGSPHFSDSFQI